MSSLPPKADIRTRPCNVCFVPKTDIKRLLNHLVGAGKDSRWNCESQSFRGLKIDDQLILRRHLNWKVARLLTLEDAIHVAGRAPELVDGIGTIGDQAATVDELA